MIVEIGEWFVPTRRCVIDLRSMSSLRDLDTNWLYLYNPAIPSGLKMTFGAVASDVESAEGRRGISKPQQVSA